VDQNGYVLARHAGGISETDLVEMLQSAHGKKDHGNVLIRKAKRSRDPEDIFQAGVYFSEAGQHKKARVYFLRGWRTQDKKNLTIRLDCLFNAAVNSMELTDYRSAVDQWTLYLKNAPDGDSNRPRALLYRGIARKNLGQNEKAAMDIENSLDGLDKKTADAAKKLLLKLK
jgi:hypothetical protein